MEENLRAFRDAGKPRCCVYRRRSEASIAAAGCRSPFNPPPLPELALFGLIVQPPRELTASKSKENQGKRLGFPCIPLVEYRDFSMGYGEKIKKILCLLNSLVRLRANTRPGRIFTASRTQRAVDCQLASAERYILFFCICQRIGRGPRGRRPIRMSLRLAQQISSRPGGDDVRSSFVVRLATSSPPSSREEPGAPVPVRRGALSGET